MKQREIYEKLMDKVLKLLDDNVHLTQTASVAHVQGGLPDLIGIQWQEDAIWWNKEGFAIDDDWTGYHISGKSVDLVQDVRGKWSGYFNHRRVTAGHATAEKAEWALKAWIRSDEFEL